MQVYITSTYVLIINLIILFTTTNYYFLCDWGNFIMDLFWLKIILDYTYESSTL